MPTISVVINTYNSARFLQETVTSVLSQSFTDFELLIIDDGSQDNTLKIAASIQDPRVQIHAYENGGIARNRNRGLEQASGEFIAFLDHDDRWHPQKLEQQLQALISNPNAAFVYSWIETIDETGNRIRRYPPVSHQGQIFDKLLVQNFLHTASNPLFRRAAVTDVGGLDETIYGADDWDLLIQLAAKYEVALSPHYHIQYRIVEGSGSAKVEKVEQGALQVINKAFQAAPVEFQSLRQAALGRLYQYLCFRSLEEMSSRQSGVLAWRYLWQSRHYAPLLWQLTPLAKALFKISLSIALPASMSKPLVRWTVQQAQHHRAASLRMNEEG
jgi:glycosyltransferase involved in cell wall biosynthesis